MDDPAGHAGVATPATGGPAVRDERDAVLAWRYWQIDPRSRFLRSVSMRRFEWPIGRPLRATCVGGGHPAPDRRCNCGIYGAHDLASLRDHGLCLSPQVLVVGRVALWGRLVAAEGGFRGEYAMPAALRLVPETAGEEGPEEILAKLRAYTDDIGTIELRRAVGDISAATLANLAMSRTAGARRTSP